MLHLFNSKIGSLFDKINWVDTLARKKFVASGILAMIKSKKVQFSELAFHLNPEAKTESNIRRIQAFFQQYDFDYERISVLLACFLPTGKVRVCLDRTEWDFGLCQVNILAVRVHCKGVGIPVYFEMLDNHSGCSKYLDRITLLEKVVNLLGVTRIEAVIADREFIGQKWYNYLLNSGLSFYLRLPKSTLLTVNGLTKRAADFLTDRYSCQLDQVKIGPYYLSVAMGKDKLSADPLIVLTNTFAHQAIHAYKKRWSIEVFFQSIKRRGFDLESSHLQSLEKLKKLFALVCIAYHLCLQVAIEYHHKVQKIRTQKNGYKINSFFRKGLDVLRQILMNQKEGDLFKLNQFVNKLYRMILLQLITKQTFIKIIV